MASPKDQYACAHICVEVDLEVGLPKEIKLMVGNWFHFQKLDYEQLPFKCRGCHEYRHFYRNCPQKQDAHQEKEEGWQTAKRSKTKSKNGETQIKEGGNNDQRKVIPEIRPTENQSGSSVIKEISISGEEKDPGKEIVSLDQSEK